MQVFTERRRYHHILTYECYPAFQLTNFHHRPNTGTQVWMRWREPSLTRKGRLSTDSLGSGMKQFSVETRLQPHASGEQVWQVSTCFILYVLPATAAKAVGVVCLQCRCNASGPWAVLWFYQICNWAEWVGPISEAAATIHRHQTTCRPKVRANTQWGGGVCYGQNSEISARVLSIKQHIFYNLTSCILVTVLTGCLEKCTLYPVIKNSTKIGTLILMVRIERNCRGFQSHQTNFRSHF